MTKDLKPTASTIPASEEPHAASAVAESNTGSALTALIDRAKNDLDDLPATTVVFDLETTGLSPMWDQILQVGAIRADSDSLRNEDAQTDVINLRCRLKPQIIPSPGALLTTRVWPDMLESPELSHDEMMRRVSDFLAESRPAVFVGHNAIRFDSAHLRHNLFSALFPPYVLHLDGSRLVDTMLLAQLIHALDPGAMNWPRKPDGKMSFRLGDLCSANGIALDPGEAHDALADVTATLKLYALMRERAPDVFALGHALADKRFVTEMALENEIFGIIRVSGSGATVTPVTTLPAIHRPEFAWPNPNFSLRMPGNQNALVAIDLRIDPATYIDLEPGELQALIAGKSSPVKPIRTNAMPLVIPLDVTAPSAPAAARNIRLDGFQGDAAAIEAELFRRALVVRKNPQFLENLRMALEQRETDRPISVYLEEQLYAGGFARDGDFAEGRRLLEMSAGKRHLWIDKITDYRLRIHALRLIHATAPETLEPEQRRLLDRWLRDRLITTDDNVPWLTIPKAIAETEALRQSMVDQADAESCRRFPDPAPSERCPDTGVWIVDHQAIEEIERQRLGFIEEQIGTDLALLDDYLGWLQARLIAIQSA